MTTEETKPRGRVYDTLLPTPEGQGTYAPTRVDRYGSPMVRTMDLFAHAEQGTLFVAHNAINDAATTLAGHVAPVLVDADDSMTKPLFFMRNPSTTKRIIPLYIELDCIVIGASGTTDSWSAQLDKGATRWSSGGSALTIVNPNTDKADASVLSATNALLGGAVVVGAETSEARQLGHGQIRGAIMVAADRYCFKFGGYGDVGANVVATAASRHMITMPPVILGPTGQFLLALCAPLQAVTAAVYKMRCAWLEV